MQRNIRFLSIRFGLICLAYLLTSPAAHATVRNVPAAYPGIQTAINAAVAGDTVLVAPGVYSVSGIDTLGKAITIKSAGGASTCILDGGANQMFNLHSGESTKTVINGFTLQHGDSSSGVGGACFVAFASPTITNCVFQNNNSQGGGAIYLFGSKAAITNCIFQTNTAASAGGGIEVDTSSSPSLTGCTFQSCSAAYGGGIYVNINANAKLTKCTLTGNVAYYGGGLYLYGGSSKLTTCTIDTNTALTFGGGVYCEGGKPAFSGCLLNGNTANYGGGMVVDGANATLTNTEIANNQATGQDSGYGGGGLWIATNYASSSPVVTNCLFDGNSALNGGAIWNNGGSPNISRCTFSVNSAASGGGGLYTDSGKTVLVNCVFDHCTVTGYGGAMRFTGSSAVGYVTNCSLYGGYANAHGDGIYVDTSATLTVANSILWDPDSPGYELNTDNTASISVTYSDMLGGWLGTGNLNADPLYADPTNGDLYLQAGSPCILAGSGSVVYFPKTDIDGVVRSTTKPSMGAYEVP